MYRLRTLHRRMSSRPDRVDTKGHVTLSGMQLHVQEEDPWSGMV